MAELKFLPNEADEGEGLSDAGIETYRADPFPAVARETGQNSRDAHDKAHSDSPVRLVIDKLTVPTASLPAVEKYRTVIAACLKDAQQRKDAKEMAFFRQATKVLGESTIRVLRIRRASGWQ